MSSWRSRLSGPGSTPYHTGHQPSDTDAMMDSVPCVFLTGHVRTGCSARTSPGCPDTDRHHDADRQSLLHDPSPQEHSSRESHEAFTSPAAASRAGLLRRHPDGLSGGRYRLRAFQPTAAALLQPASRAPEQILQAPPTGPRKALAGGAAAWYLLRAAGSATETAADGRRRC